MGQSFAEYFSQQFYIWEYRGRGWHLENVPTQLEPPFVPFTLKTPHLLHIDDGKHHTLVSRAIEYITKKGKTTVEELAECNEEELELFEYENPGRLSALQIKMPAERTITPERMKALILLLSSNAALTSFEIFGTSAGITIQFVCPEETAFGAAIHINAFFPELTIIETSDLDSIFSNQETIYVTDFGLEEEFFRPLPTYKNFNLDPLTALIAVLDRLGEHESGGIQILFSVAANPWAHAIVQAVTLNDGSSCFYNSPEAPKLAMEKIASPLFGVAIRAFGQGATSQGSKMVFDRIYKAIMQAYNGPTNRLIPLPHEVYTVEARISDIYLRQSHRLGMLLNTDELVTLLHFPSESIQSKKLYGGSRKTKAVPAIAVGKPFVIGRNIHNDTEQAITTNIDARLKHTHIIGATGTGKSTLLANLIIQDIMHGLGLALFDPHGDLVDDIIGHLPENRLRDVVLVDPSDTEFPIGLNLLQAHNDIEKEILSSDLVASFRKLSTSWGDQMNAVFGNAILAMLESSKGGTLHDLRRFLVEKEYREEYLQTISDPTVQYYWHKEYPLLKTNSTGSILTRLDSFLRPRTIRNIVTQKAGLDFETLINTNKIILVKLSQGLIGTENSYLLGSLILSKIHQAAFARQNKQVRNPFFIYLDEFQNFITPSIKELLSGVRKYSVGLVLSHQNLQQLQHEASDLIESVLGNTYNRIVFRVGETDARKLKDGFTGFDSTDLQNLGRGEAVIRIEQPQFDCSLQTSVLPVIEKYEQAVKLQAVIQNSRKLYATAKAQVEAVLTEDAVVDSKTDNKPTIEPESLKQNIPVPEPQPREDGTTKRPRKEKNSTADNSAADGSTTHKYLQQLIKRMAESRGYVVTIELSLPDNRGSIDLVITKDGKATAIEICNTTNAEWEMHNIIKCIESGYSSVISISEDSRQLEKIKDKCKTGIASFSKKDIQFFTPENLFAYLDSQVVSVTSTETTIRGYRVNVSYDAMTAQEMNKKRSSVAEVIKQSMQRIKKR